MISIIIPTYNHLEDCLKPCLESIFRYTGKAPSPEGVVPVEIIVVANGCTDGTKAYLKTQKVKTLWFDEPLGYARANNEGIKVAKGDYIVLLNNDTVLLPQAENQWLKILMEPFKNDAKMGITGPSAQFSEPAGCKFMIFFCAMIRRRVFDEVGELDPIFGVGGGEDTDFCIRAEKVGWKLAQVPGETSYNGQFVVGAFPIYHKGEATVNDNPKWQEIFKRNSNILANRYNRKWVLCNQYERAVIGRDDYVPPREDARYRWAATYAHGRVLEIGCSSGYGTRYLHGVDYLGIDRDKAIIEYAREEFPEYRFEVMDVNDLHVTNKYDTIIAFEVIEHLENGKALAQKLKNYCKTLIITSPYNETKGFWGTHHKLHGLKAEHFPGFKLCGYITEGGLEVVPRDNLSLMALLWEEDEAAKQPNIAKPAKQVGSNSESNPTPNDSVQKLNTISTIRTIPPVTTVSPTEESIANRLITNNQTSNGELPLIMAETKLTHGVTAVVCTRNRSETTLSLCLQAILMQTVPPNGVFIYDDSDKQRDLRTVEPYKQLFMLMQQKGIGFQVAFGNGTGQVRGHKLSLKESKTKYLWRVDDDCIPEPTCLEKLMLVMESKPDCGACGGLVLDTAFQAPSTLASSKIGDIYLGLNVQWFKHDKVGREPYAVDHLYSTFLYKRGEDYYPSNLSRIGHREETIATYRMKRAGMGLWVVPEAITWHLKANSGGIRDGFKEMWEKDEAVFGELMRDWGVKVDERKIITLDCGLGDHYAFRGVLPDILARYPRAVIACCYPDVFKGFKVDIISIAEAYAGNHREGIYKFMYERQWKRSLTDAYRAMYLS